MKKKNFIIWACLIVIIIGYGISNSAKEDNKVEETKSETSSSSIKQTINNNNSSSNIPKEIDSTTLKDETLQKEVENQKLNGRGRSDGGGRAEPQYEGLFGFVALSSSDVSKLSDFQEVFPDKPWYVHTVEQIGEDMFKETESTIEHKTKVKVIQQMLTHKGYGNYDGALLVEDTNNNQFLIDVYNFVTFSYWDENISEAVKQGPIIATYNGKGDKPTDKYGEWVDIELNSLVIADGIENYGKINGKIRAEVYKEWALRYGGVDVYFSEDSLDIIY